MGAASGALRATQDLHFLTMAASLTLGRGPFYTTLKQARKNLDEINRLAANMGIGERICRNV